MPSSSSPSSKHLCAMRGSTLGLCNLRFNRFDGMAAAGFRPFGQCDPGIPMFTPAGTLQCIRAGLELQRFQGIRMRWWLCWCDVHGLRFQFLCCWKGLQGVPRLWFGISKPLAIHPRHRDSDCCRGSLAMEAEAHRTRGGGGTLQFVLHRIHRANPNSRANPFTALSLGDVNAFEVCVSLFTLFLHNFLKTIKIFFIIFNFCFETQLQGQLWGVLAALRKTTTDAPSLFWEIPYIETLQFSLSSLKGALNLQCKFDAWH